MTASERYPDLDFDRAWQGGELLPARETPFSGIAKEMADWRLVQDRESLYVLRGCGVPRVARRRQIEADVAEAVYRRVSHWTPERRRRLSETMLNRSGGEKSANAHAQYLRERRARRIAALTVAA